MARLGAPSDDIIALRRSAYAQLDPLVRAPVRGRVQAAVAEAALSTMHANDDAHVHRLALLSTRGMGPSSDDVSEVRAAFDAALAAKPARVPSRYGASALLLSAIVLTGLSAALRAWAPDHWFDDTLSPTDPKAFSAGGRPSEGSAEVRALFRDDIPAFVIALDAARAKGAAGKSSALDAAETHALAQAEKVLGREEASFLGAVFAQSRTLSAAVEPPTVDSYLRSVDAFNAAVERRGLGYYLDAEVVAARVYLSSFAVRRVTLVRAEGRTLRALRLGRLDTLNFVRGVLGFTRPHIRDALVLEERVDSFLVTDVLPALAPGEKFALASAYTSKYRPEGLEQLELATAAATRLELANVAGQCESLADTSALFARRRAVFAEISEHVTRNGGFVAVPTSYDFDAARFENVEMLVGPDTFRELERVADALDAHGHRACFRALREVLIPSVERHELQHRLDYASGTLERLPAELERRVGPLDAYGLRNVGAESAMAETSAYLSELARGPSLIKLNLALLAQHAIDRYRWGTGEYFAAVVIFEGLARELGLSAEQVGTGRPPERVARALGLMLTKNESTLAAAATRLWQALMAKPLARLVPYGSSAAR